MKPSDLACTTTMREMRPLASTGLLACVVVLLTVLACAPVVPLRTKPGGAASWAVALARESATLWSTDARLCRVTGTGVGSEGWLPDRGGVWTVSFWSPSKDAVMHAVVDSDGNVSTRESNEPALRGAALPATWADSPRAWAATRSQQQGEPINTLDCELSHVAEPERYPEQTVWRIRFFLREGQQETHVVSADGRWLTRY